MRPVILDLVSLIYDSVIQPSGWQTFLAEFVRANNGSRGSIILSSGHNDDSRDVVCWHGWDEKDLHLYLTQYATKDPWHGGFARITEGEVLTSEEICSEEMFRASAAYREFYSVLDVHHGLGGAFLKSGKKISAIFVQRSKQSGPCGQRELDITRALVPHLRRAALLHGELTALRMKLSAFTSHLDRYPQPFFLMNGDRRVFYANEAAHGIVNRGQGISMKADLLHIVPSRAAVEFQRAVRAIATDRKSPLRRVSIERPHGKPPYKLLLMPLLDLDVMPLGVSQPAVAVIVIDLDAPPPLDLAAMQELFSLTGAEARITGLLAHGRNIDEAASELGIARETVRTHIRRILSKTATSRQGELISLVLRAIPFRPPNLSKAAGGD